MAQKLIIDADLGIGDATAVLLALLDPEIDVVGLTGTAGVVSGPQAARNLQLLTEIADPPRRPRIGSTEDPESYFELGYGTQTASLRELNGPQGLGDLNVEVPDLVARRESQKVITELVRDNPNNVTLLTLGPLTNIAAACERVPDLPAMLSSLICLGGSVSAGGNVTAAAEFNVFSNPGAARTVLRSRASKMLIPLDITERFCLTPTDIQTSACNRIVETIQQMLQFALRRQRQFFGSEGICLPELVALACVSRPSLFEFEGMVIDVETAGEITRGTTVFDRRGTQHWQKNIQVCVDINIRGIVDYFQEMLQRAAAVA